MNWKQEAIEKLEQYGAKKRSLQIIPEEIAGLEAAATRMRRSRTDRVHINGSELQAEDVLLSNIVKREELGWSLEQARRWVDLVDAGLSVLNTEERQILDRFYVSGGKGAADDLASELALDVKTIYRRKDAALRRFTIALCGSVES